MSSDMQRDALDLWQRVQQRGPLVQCITNYVSMDIMANMLLAAGMSPAMAHSLDEVEEFVRIASALLINMGTLSSDWVASKKLAAKEAVAVGKPWVLDPVGCGATSYRTAACVAMLRQRPAVVRGNASEILALAGAAADIKGVDSTAASHEALDAAKQLATANNCVVAVSGAVDLVTDGSTVLEVHNGVAMLTKITAAGCSVTALIAGFLAVAQPHETLLATAAAMAVFGFAAELGAAGAAGPGSLRVGLLDSLHKLAGAAGSDEGRQQLLQGLKITQRSCQ